MPTAKDWRTSKHIFSCYVTNDVSVALIDKALKDKGPSPRQTEETRPKEVGEWPGMDLMSPNETSALALNGMFRVSQHEMVKR
jgi:hypothetical protein